MQFEPLRMRKVSFFFYALFSFCSAGVVVAAEWSIEPSISLREEYNDNIRFSATSHPGVWLSRLTPSVKLSSKTEVSEVSGSAQLSVNQYSGDPLVANHNDKLFSLLTSFRSERNAWAMNAFYKQDSTAESERIATGIVQVRTQRSTLSLSPSWTRTLTERASFKLDYNYQEVKYDEHINLNDYTYQHVGGTLQYTLTERAQVNVSANYSVVEFSPIIRQLGVGAISINPPVVSLGGTDTIINESRTSNVQAGVTHMFSETLRGSISLGTRSTVTSVAHACTSCVTTGFAPISTFENETSGSGSSLNGTLEETFESTKVSVFASRDATPSGNGLVETDKFGLSLNRTLTENLTGSFDAVTYRTKYIGVVSPGSQYLTVEPKLNWRLTELWAINAGYRYARYEPEGSASSITANAVYLNLSYNWPKMAISR